MRYELTKELETGNALIDNEHRYAKIRLNSTKNN